MADSNTHVSMEAREFAAMLALECNPEEADVLVPFYNDGGDSPLAEIIQRAMDQSALAEREACGKDKARFDFLMRESYDLRCFSVPTGGDDYDIGWRVIGHWMADPQERTIAEVYHDDPREAVDQAMDLTPAQLRAISHPSAIRERQT